MASIKTLLDEQELRRRIQELADEISDAYGSEEIVAVGLLKGSFIFLADLVRALHSKNMQVKMDFMRVSSYGAGTVSSGEVRLQKDIDFPILGHNILIVDDILDSGNSLSMVLRHLAGHNPKSMKTCVLLDKPERRAVNIEADFVGFTIPNHFVIGYGLDHDEKYRELPYIGVVET